MAAAGLILGILSIAGNGIPALRNYIWLFGIMGIIFSAVARSKAKKEGEPTGMATAGLILSIIGIISSIVILIALGALFIGLLFKFKELFGNL